MSGLGNPPHPKTQTSYYITKYGQNGHRNALPIILFFYAENIF